VRQAISAELLQLRNIDAIDREGLYIRIDNIASQLSNVEMLNFMRQNFENRRSPSTETLELNASPGSNTTTTGWLDASLDFLGSVFVWRKWEESPTAMLAPGSENTIRQNLRLMLEQAQLALLLRDGELYRQSLGKSRQWIQSYVATDTAAGQAVLNDLLELEAIDIEPALPVLSQSLELISQVNAGQRSTSL
jgi:uroporphyrin-3 C-methyltransferase